MKIIASVSGLGINGDESDLVPYRLVVPSFLPPNARTAKMMVSDLVDEAYCENAWVHDEDDPRSGPLWSALESLDWEKAQTLQYDWAERDCFGDVRWIPWELWTSAADMKKRAPGLEPFIFDDYKKAEAYAKGLDRDQWQGWTLEELGRNPCWCFYYAKDVCKGRLPEVLDNMMAMLSFQNPDNPWVKRYFKTKKYRKRNRKALAGIAP